MGDIHGAYRAMQQCFNRCGFNYENDMLIQLGDVADGFDEVYACVEALLAIKNLVAIKGNHDDWFNGFLQTGFHPMLWAQGAVGTAVSYLKNAGKKPAYVRSGEGYRTSLSTMDVPLSHHQFFNRQQLYYIDESNNCFVHAGFKRRLPFKDQDPFTYYWDRSLWTEALSFQAGNRGIGNDGTFHMETSFNTVFIGHTHTLNWKTDQPMHAANIFNIDTGAGHTGRLTIMEVETKQFWQSDVVTELYDKSYR